LKIDVYPAGAIVPATKEIDGIRTGALNIAHQSSAYNIHLFPAADLFDQMSGGLSNVQFMFWWSVGGGNELARKAYEPFGAYYISQLLLSPEDFAYVKGFELKTLDDVKKLKMRTAGDGGAILAKMGASTVFLPGGEIYESMQRGVINAFEYSSAAIAWDVGFQEVMDNLYLSYSRAPCDCSHYQVRMEDWQALPDDLKELVWICFDQTRLDFYNNAVANDAVALQKFADYGVNVQKLPKEIEDAFLIAGEEFINDKMQGKPLYTEVVESMRAFKAQCEVLGIY
jgi:TRAP-type mannitol/chloroaromatic compound transport system substrate-binding protein